MSDKFDLIANRIIDALENVFGVSIEQARQWLAIPNSEEYSRTIRDHAEGGGGMPHGGPDAPQEGGAPDQPHSDNSLIDQEEAELERGI